MDEMVSTYGKRIPVTAGLPDGKAGVCHLDSCGNGGSPAVNAVEAICIHIVRKPGRAADTGHHHVTLFLVAQGLRHFRHGSLQGRKYGMVSAARTPSHFLVAFEILECISGHNFLFLMQILRSGRHRTTMRSLWRRQVPERGTAVPALCCTASIYV